MVSDERAETTNERRRDAAAREEGLRDGEDERT